MMALPVHKLAFVASLVLLHLSSCQGFCDTHHLQAKTSTRKYFEVKAAPSDGDHADTTTSSRRGFLGISAAMASSLLVSAPQTALADPSLFSSLQGPVQDAIAPGHWIGQFIGINSRQVTWDFSYSPERVSQTLVEVFEGLTKEQRAALIIPELEITQADATKVHVRTWTKNEWLDSLDVTFSSTEKNTCQAKASFYATGFLPTSIPGAPLINVAFSWFPFASPGPRGQMLQEYRLQALEKLVRDKLAASDQVDRISTMI